MRDATIKTHDLRTGDWLIKKSIDNPFDFQLVTKIDSDEKNRVYYAYINNSSWYFTLNFDDVVNISIV